IGAWSTTKIPMLTFEIASLGFKFALLRLACSIVGITIIAFILIFSLKETDHKMVYANSDSII
ncbi:MAG: permease, partial [Sphaerochaetaceae bacterium]|nr:permease [Sphaerochaetaceae bacterium]